MLSLKDFKILSSENLQEAKDAIYRATWSPNGKYIAAASSIGDIYLWSLESGKIIQTIKCFNERILSIAWSPNGKYIAIGGSTRIIQIWNIKQDRLEQRLIGHSDWIRDIAWSPNGKQIVSCSSDQGVWLWATETGQPLCRFEGHTNWVKGVAWSPDGQFIVSGADDGTVRLWDTKGLNCINILTNKDSFGSIYSVDWSNNSLFIAVASSDKTIKIWDGKTYKHIITLEGHITAISNICFSKNNKLLASISVDGIIRLWDCNFWKEIASISGSVHSSQSWPSVLAFHPNSLFLATPVQEGAAINILTLEHQTTESSSDLLNSKASSQESIVYYINAKAVLLGESGVGKSGLGIRLAEKEFRKTESTHGAQFWQFPVAQKSILDENQENINAELTLWDLAGQPDYHLVHQLFLDDTDVALLLFDCSNTAEPFRGIPYWAKVLKKIAPTNALKYLISARCDVSPVTVDQREINQFIGEYGLDGYFRSSAKTGEGVEQLLQQIIAAIPWDKLPRTTTPRLFQVIREFLLERKEAEDTLILVERVTQEVDLRYIERSPTQAEIDTVISLLQARGLVYRLAPTPNMQMVLLRPELINQYASSIIKAARNHPEGIGSILERDVVCANFSFDGFSREERLPLIEEKLVLESTVELFISYNLAFRELGRLIFPSHFNVLHRFVDKLHPPTEVTYEFSGSIEAIYASLVVCLSYTKDFQRENLWKYAAEFSRNEHRLGFAMKQVSEGTGELEIYFYPGVSDFDRVTFIRFITNHLHIKGINVQERIRLYCSNAECGKEVTNREAIEIRVKAGKLEIPCQYCDTNVLIPRSIEEKYRSDRAYTEKQQELRTTVEKRTEAEVNAFYHDKEIYMNNADKQIRILHLSDIHLGTTAQAQRYFTQLATDLTQNLNVKQLNYLVISGDIANRSTQEEYDAAFELVDKLVKRYGLDPSRIVIVPGNHDINWELSEIAYPFVPKRKLPNPLPEGKYIDAGSAGALICDENEYKKRFDYFSDRFYKKIYSKYYPQEYDQQAIIHLCAEDKILFLGLNSCWEIDHEYKDRAGIHPNAIANALDQILTGNYDDWLKIAVWHHPVHSSESMKNTAFLEQLAVNGFQVGIHGHIHEAKRRVRFVV
ncbi:metallophosphoesterase [Nostoc sp. CALU 546]|uniref:metallophosphoesterase n=1 Tax=Nostoc sp. CALU 546 TaxID=1867241 RepID=UPI003B671E1C